MKIWVVFIASVELSIVSYLLRKNLTSRKLTGMQMQSVGIMAICFIKPKPTKRLRKSVCIE